MSTQVYSRTIASTFEYDSTATGYSGTWGPINLTVTQLNSSIAPTQGSEILIYYLISATSLGSPISTVGQAYTGFVRVPTYGPANATNNDSFILTPCDQATGSYLYIWLSHDICGQPVTVTINASGPATSGGGGSGVVQVYSGSAALPTSVTPATTSSPALYYQDNSTGVPNVFYWSVLTQNWVQFVG